MRCWVVNENIGMTVVSGRFPCGNRGFTYEYLLSLVETEIIGLFMCCR